MSLFRWTCREIRSKFTWRQTSWRRRERYLVYELLPGGDVHSRLNKDLRRNNVVMQHLLKPFVFYSTKFKETRTKLSMICWKVKFNMCFCERVRRGHAQMPCTHVWHCCLVVPTCCLQMTGMISNCRFLGDDSTTDDLNLGDVWRYHLMNNQTKDIHQLYNKSSPLHKTS